MIIDCEVYKIQICNFLSVNVLDVVIWYVVNCMCLYVEVGLFEDVLDLWVEDLIVIELVLIKGVMIIDGVQWGVLYIYYQWGVYYCQDIFEELGLIVLIIWEEELVNCVKIVDLGCVCYIIGIKYLWIVGGWFDYLNMCINGFDFYMQLVVGEVEWIDLCVCEIFNNWCILIDMGGFIVDYQIYLWQEVLLFMINGEVVVYLMGNFVVVQLCDGGLIDDQLSFYQFLVINLDVELVEDVLIDIFYILVGVQNKEVVCEFLCFVVLVENQIKINVGDVFGQLFVNLVLLVDDDEFLNVGFEMLLYNLIGGVVQFFDCDFLVEMVVVGMEGFQEFMVFLDNLDDILQCLEVMCQSVYQ